MDRPQPQQRSRYPWFLPIPIATQWKDNDVYGHVNNAVHHTWFDTTVNRWLIDQGHLDPFEGSSIGLVVRNQCDYFSAICFPDLVHAGLAATRVGRSSITYEIGLFRNNDSLSLARGLFTHAYVDARTHRPVDLPEALKNSALLLAPED